MLTKVRRVSLCHFVGRSIRAASSCHARFLDNLAAISGDVTRRRVDTVGASEANIELHPHPVKWMSFSTYKLVQLVHRFCTLDTWVQPLPTQLIKVEFIDKTPRINSVETQLGERDVNVALGPC